jgi:membrane protease YdiL (CAAX protease family)
MSVILGLGNPVALLWDSAGSSPINLVRILFFTLLLGPVSEEPGWRGFFTDSMIGRYAFSKTAGLTGLIWGIWHVPLFFIPGSGQHSMGLFTLGFFVFFATPVVFSFLLLILYLRTGGSIAAAILLHFSINLSLVVFPLNSAGYGIFTLFLAVFVLLLYRSNSYPGESCCSCVM